MFVKDTEYYTYRRINNEDIPLYYLPNFDNYLPFLDDNIYFNAYFHEILTIDIYELINFINFQFDNSRYPNKLYIALKYTILPMLEKEINSYNALRGVQLPPSKKVLDFHQYNLDKIYCVSLVEHSNGFYRKVIKEPNENLSNIEHNDILKHIFFNIEYIQSFLFENHEEIQNKFNLINEYLEKTPFLKYANRKPENQLTTNQALFLIDKIRNIETDVWDELENTKKARLLSILIGKNDENIRKKLKNLDIKGSELKGQIKKDSEVAEKLISDCLN